MADTRTCVLVAGYPDIETATKDFDALVAAVKAKKVKIEGAILVTHDEDGKVVVQQTGDHLGPQGHGLGRRRRRARRPGRAAAARRRRRRRRGRRRRRQVRRSTRSRRGLAGQVGENAQAGHGRDHRDVRRRGPPRRRAGAAGRAGRSRSSQMRRERASTALKDALAEAMGKFNPDRTVLPIPDRAFGGVAGPHDGRRPSPTGRSSPARRRPRARPNVLLVLIDDAGFGGPDTFGGGIRTPNLTRVQQMGLTYNRFHVTAVCSPTRAALLTGRNHHRVGMGGIAEFPGPFPGYTGTRPRSCTALPRILQGERLRHRRLRQVAHDARPRDGRRRPVRPLAARRGASTTGGAS